MEWITTEDNEVNDNELRKEMFEESKIRLERLAYKAIHDRKMGAEEFIVVCIDVDDPAWTDLAFHLMPGTDWQQYRNLGQRPMARGIVLAYICGYLGEVVPAIKEALFRKLPENTARAVIMGGGGASVYFIEPVSEKRRQPVNN